ncbi:hypothetical protein F441_12562 [Phytophthora nicotianae CJ01A1]|uniref:Uncharacterized protein n=6 Tax=Phytophthora nicotianae TaxID=4792 RepID=W2PY64_PHYN3|nr:hypothetical protein PPTG_23455 [Phytophthora nicotianae INRA-310]ETI42241.1 hypothetical protein F443_12597 [Phytophthora nicotianae P1569]ETK82256.1 hypothetical protein L915_12328 [Phytophthora nicotianae]ETO70860.1 hypothetical protein F444_12699 [Phytophthora nicotianae P1976]ETP11981.1 hypothetical protein F441_12562 [Phytophthora nicotianae CJ01A1]ETP40095.1 hypothetical protein F442_12514 [Phytophthora nicotianae P10297]
MSRAITGCTCMYLQHQHSELSIRGHARFARSLLLKIIGCFRAAASSKLERLLEVVLRATALRLTPGSVSLTCRYFSVASHKFFLDRRWTSPDRIQLHLAAVVF